MKDDVAQKLEEYFGEWNILRDINGLDDLSYTPSSVGWKVADLAEFVEALHELLEGDVEQAHIGRVNDRYIASIVFREAIGQGIHTLKLMQRRSGSSDPIGLDHVDFTIKDLNVARTRLQKAKLSFELESNDAHEWLSLRFGEHGQREAKFFDHTVIDVCIQELTDIKRQIKL